MQTELLLEAGSSSRPAKSHSGQKQGGPSTKMYAACSAAMKGGILLRWLESWLGPKLTFSEKAGEMPEWRLGQEDSSSGSLWMRNIAEWNPIPEQFPSDGSVCSLSEILEPGPIGRRYFLSKKACAGILRRAANRGKELPERLRLALEAVAALEPDFECSGGLVESSVAHTLLAKDNDSHAADLDTYVAHALRAEGFDASEDGTGRGTPIIPEVAGSQTAKGDGGHYIPEVCGTLSDGAHNGNRCQPREGDPCHPLAATAHPPAIAFDCKAAGNTGFAIGDVPGSLRGEGHGGGHAAIAFSGRERGDDGRGYERPPNVTGEVAGTVDTVKPGNVCHNMAVRRLTPRECERLMGMPDDYTLIEVNGKPAKDGPRYRALGNSFCVNVVRWIGERIEAVDAIP